MSSQVPNPDAAQVNATNTCVAGCPQGDSSAADSLKYQNCVAACIGANYFTSTGTPAPTGAAAAADGSSDTAATGVTKTGTATGKTNSASGTAASASASSAGEAVRVGTSALGLLGLAAALFAL